MLPTANDKYGVSNMAEAMKWVPKHRLDAIHYAAECVRCASEQEEVLNTIE